MISKTINVKLKFRAAEWFPNYKLRPDQFKNIDEYTLRGYIDEAKKDLPEIRSPEGLNCKF